MLPSTYVSGDSLESSLVFAGATFESLGMDVGTFVWAWDADSVTLEVVPVPAALPLLGTAVAGLGFARWRRQRKNAKTA